MLDKTLNNIRSPSIKVDGGGNLLCAIEMAVINKSFNKTITIVVNKNGPVVSRPFSL